MIADNGISTLEIVVIPGLVALAVASLLVISQVRAHRSRRAKFEGRTMMTMEQWYTKHYAHHGMNVSRCVVENTLSAFGEAYGIEPTLLQPEDRFDYELKLSGPLSIDDSVGSLVYLLEKKFGESAVFNASWKTVNDVIVGLAQSETSQS